MDWNQRTDEWKCSTGCYSGSPFDPDGSVWKKRREIDNAQLQTAAELQKLREDLERIERKQDENQKAQEKDAKKSYAVSLIAIGLNALAIVVAVLIAFLN